MNALVPKFGDRLKVVHKLVLRQRSRETQFIQFLDVGQNSLNLTFPAPLLHPLQPDFFLPSSSTIRASLLPLHK